MRPVKRFLRTGFGSEKTRDKFRAFLKPGTKITIIAVETKIRAKIV
jgi:hypothetical protein